MSITADRFIKNKKWIAKGKTRTSNSRLEAGVMHLGRTYVQWLGRGGEALWSNKPGILMLLTNWFKVWIVKRFGKLVSGHVHKCNSVVASVTPCFTCSPEIYSTYKQYWQPLLKLRISNLQVVISTILPCDTWPGERTEMYLLLILNYIQRLKIIMLFDTNKFAMHSIMFIGKPWSGWVSFFIIISF